MFHLYYFINFIYIRQLLYKQNFLYFIVLNLKIFLHFAKFSKLNVLIFFFWFSIIFENFIFIFNKFYYYLIMLSFVFFNFIYLIPASLRANIKLENSLHFSQIVFRDFSHSFVLPYLLKKIPLFGRLKKNKLCFVIYKPFWWNW